MNEQSSVRQVKKHPSAFNPAILVLNIFLSVLGAIIGLELIVRIGISTNTSIVGALFAIILSRIPISIFRRYKDIHAQNLVQTAISGATFSAANSLILPICIPYLMGEPRLVVPMLIGVLLATIIDGTIMYKTFDTPMFPAEEPWPPGIAAAETILAVVNKGKKAMLLLAGMGIGIAGKALGIPTDLLGVAWIGDMWALGAFGAGALVIGISNDTHFDIGKYYVPHGIMIGAGLVALIQVGFMLFKKENGKESVAGKFTSSISDMRGALVKGYIAYVVVAIGLAAAGGLYSELSFTKLIIWIIYAAFAAIASELIVGMSAMHSGWFPGFATALIFLLVGMMLGFPKLPLGILAGYTAATGPAFSDMAYDLKCGYILRGKGIDPEFERAGRKQQYIASVIAFVIAFLVVLFMFQTYFKHDLFAPVARVFVTTIEAGSSRAIAKYLIIFAVPGAVIQLIGGPKKQLGVLFSTGLLVGSAITGITVIIALAIRLFVVKMKGEEGQGILYILGAGSIAGAALYSFFTSTLQLGKPRK